MEIVQREQLNVHLFRRRCCRHETDDTQREWFSYRKIPSLKHYLVVAQDRRVVQVHSRAGELWRERFVASGVLELDDPPVRLELDGLYAKTDVAA